MRIGPKILLVGAIPIAIAAVIAVAAWMLLGQADRARQGAVLAGAFYRNLSLAVAARDDYVKARPDERIKHLSEFASFAQQAQNDMNALISFAGDRAQQSKIDESRDALSLFMRRMAEYVQATDRNDLAAASMAERAASLIALTDQARARQHASNQDIMASLTDRDRKVRFAREIVDKAQELITGIDAVELHFARAPQDQKTGDYQLTRLMQIANELSKLLKEAGRTNSAEELPALVASYDAAIRASGGKPTEASKKLTDWSDRLLKVHSSERRKLHDEVAELLTYSVQANEIDQATQNIAIETLKLGQSTTKALTDRDQDETNRILQQSNNLSRRVASLPISPLIQSEMVDAIDQWRNALSGTEDALSTQNQMISDMDRSATSLLDRARDLNDDFTRFANSISDWVRSILIAGAAIGVLAGAILAIVVARSITQPLGSLKTRMMELANDPFAGPVAEGDRRDELGEMARAANFFVTEIGRREHALRRAKERADTALADLRQTQDDLIQYEKLASLGQLVAGVAHEINTPVGIALTTATSMSSEAKEFGDAAASGRLLRSEFERFVARIKEGTQLLQTNLNRAAELVYSFKQVAVDQTSGERRTFPLDSWLNELLTSLGPVLRKTGHEVKIECREGLTMDTYPGALAQVVTNLVMNAVSHAYDEDQAGHMVLRVEEQRSGWLRMTFKDDGRGIPPENHERIFEPFFTTGRAHGSTGLGLHIVYNLVTNSLQGRIDLESDVGKGTTFIIDLPKSVADAAPQKHFATA
ncbi:sensor histidine kinase [Terrihabitans soli]|nr:HAMP domain-containing sensor histidine kinase [Terrihabitans soli]